MFTLSEAPMASIKNTERRGSKFDDLTALVTCV